MTIGTPFGRNGWLSTVVSVDDLSAWMCSCRSSVDGEQVLLWWDFPKGVMITWGCGVNPGMGNITWVKSCWL